MRAFRDIRAIKFYVLGQVSLYVGLLVAVLIDPTGLHDNHGLSYWGTHAKTIAPYTIAVLGCSYFLLRAFFATPKKEFMLRFSFMADGLLMIAVFATPDTASTIVNQAHLVFSSLLFFEQEVLSLWLVIRLRFRHWVLPAFLLEAANVVLTAIYSKVTDGYLFYTQIMFELCFGVVMVIGMRHILAKYHVETQPELLKENA